MFRSPLFALATLLMACEPLPQAPGPMGDHDLREVDRGRPTRPLLDRDDARGSARLVDVGRGQRPEEACQADPNTCDWRREPGMSICPPQGMQGPEPRPESFFVPGPTDLIDPDEDWEFVSTTAELFAAGNDPNITHIALRPGTYECPPASQDPRYLRLTHQKTLVVEEPGTVTLGFGIDFKFNTFASGSTIRGLDFSVVERACAPRPNPAGPTSILRFDVPDITIEGVSLDGNWQIDGGILGSEPSGLVVRWAEILRHRQYGLGTGPLGFDSDDLNTPGEKLYPSDFVRPILHDLRIDGVRDPVAVQTYTWKTDDDPEGTQIEDPTLIYGGYFPGRDEHGMQVDVTSDVRRVRIRNAAGVGINVASNPRKSVPDSGDLSVFRVNETTFRDIDIDKIGPGADPWVPGDDSPLVDYGTLPSVNWHLGGSGVAFEKVSDGATLDRFCMGPNTGTGVHVEYRQQWPELAARNLNITNGLIDSRTERIHWNLNPEQYEGSWDNCGGYFDPNDPENDSLCDLPSPASYNTACPEVNAYPWTARYAPYFDLQCYALDTYERGLGTPIGWKRSTGVVVAIDSENIRLRNLRIRASGAAGVLTDSDPSTTSMQNMVYLDWDDTVCRHYSAPGYKLAALWGPSDDPFGAGWQYPDTAADPIYCEDSNSPPLQLP